MTSAPINAKIRTAEVGNCLYKPHPCKSTEKGPSLLRTDERRAVPNHDRIIIMQMSYPASIALSPPTWSDRRSDHAFMRPNTMDQSNFPVTILACASFLERGLLVFADLPAATMQI